MPRPGGRSMGHSKHHNAGTGPRSSRQKLAMQLQARKEEEERKKKPKAEMKGSIKELFKGE